MPQWSRSSVPISRAPGLRCNYTALLQTVEAEQRGYGCKHAQHVTQGQGPLPPRASYSQPDWLARGWSWGVGEDKEPGGVFLQFHDPVPGEKPGNTTRWWCLCSEGSQSRQMKEEVEARWLLGSL